MDKNSIIAIDLRIFKDIGFKDKAELSGEIAKLINRFLDYGDDYELEILQTTVFESSQKYG